LVRKKLLARRVLYGKLAYSFSKMDGLGFMKESPALHVIILAAGRGTRMRSRLPKVFHSLAGFSLLEHALCCAHETGAVSITVVLSPDMAPFEVSLKESYPTLNVAYQDTPRGTAHAVLATKPFLNKATGTALVLFADTPLVRPQTLHALVKACTQDDGCKVAVLALEAPNHPHYGRVVLDAQDQTQVTRIVEMKNATSQEQSLSLCNGGLMAISCDVLFDLLESVTPAPLSNEFYLTDIVAHARKTGRRVAWSLADPQELLGINTRQDLTQAQGLIQTRLRKKAMDQGATFVDPASIHLSLDTVLGQDVTVYPHVYFGTGVTVEDDVEIHSFSHLEGAHVEKGASIGPFARLRPETLIKENARVGNFVEIKKTTLGVGSKVGHLTYLGDAQCNIGAGTITCNYDGHNKHTTIVENGVFVGSNSTLIAPLHLGQGAYVGAGSVLTKDVAQNALALSRTPQKELADGATRLKNRHSSSSNKKVS
jgi:bifunctional UDP-N-acetylglucosamine pyrophosphorylase / glucosamine-1-phosphate N-acetyltransferase